MKSRKKNKEWKKDGKETKKIGIWEDFKANKRKYESIEKKTKNEKKKINKKNGKETKKVVVIEREGHKRVVN